MEQIVKKRGRPKKLRRSRGRPALTAQQLIDREGSKWQNDDSKEFTLEEELELMERPQPEALTRYWIKRKLNQNSLSN